MNFEYEHSKCSNLHENEIKWIVGCFVNIREINAHEFVNLVLNLALKIFSLLEASKNV